MSSGYQAPTTGATAIAGPNTSYDASTDGPAINYLCGDCNSKVSLKRAEPIRCKECGHRVLYKERTKRYATSCILEGGCRDGNVNSWNMRYGMVVRTALTTNAEWSSLRLVKPVHQDGAKQKLLGEPNAQAQGLAQYRHDVLMG